MNINGKIWLFVEEHESSKGKFRTYSGTISTQNEDKTYLRKSIRIQFVKDFAPKLEKLDPAKCYELEVSNGWLGVRAYQNKENKQIREFVLFIKEAKTLQAKTPVKTEKEVANDLPF